jgi:hypothetical protein
MRQGIDAKGLYASYRWYGHPEWSRISRAFFSSQNCLLLLRVFILYRKESMETAPQAERDALNIDDRASHRVRSMTQMVPGSPAHRSLDDKRAAPLRHGRRAWHMATMFSTTIIVYRIWCSDACLLTARIYPTRMPTKFGDELFALLLIAYMNTKSPELSQVRRKTFFLYFISVRVVSITLS